ncbi:MAG: ABC transporter permease [Pseudochelatococcus sp.]|jgi:putative spermidine/putrescine transport system permease protein|uniref:ABC transporter permease n=1 Tax=Pseudochelatococcus sp. TaxID=2020869 RepID=UPI003D8A9E73
MARIIFLISVTTSLIFLAVPLMLVLPLAFNDSSFLSYPMEGLTMRWFETVFTEAPWVAAFFNSVKVATGAMVVSVLVGGLAAVGTVLSGRIGQLVFWALFVSPLVIPSVVVGVALAYAFARVGISGGYVALVLAHTILGAPLVFLSVMTSLKGLNPELEKAAASLGASTFYRFRTVTLPLTAPGFLTGALFAFVTSFDEVVVALFLASPQSTTLPIALFSGLRDRLQPTIIVVALLLSLFSLLFYFILARLQRQSTPT